MSLLLYVITKLEYNPYLFSQELILRGKYGIKSLPLLCYPSCWGACHGNLYQYSYVCDIHCTLQTREQSSKQAA